MPSESVDVASGAKHPLLLLGVGRPPRDLFWRRVLLHDLRSVPVGVVDVAQASSLLSLNRIRADEEHNDLLHVANGRSEDVVAQLPCGIEILRRPMFGEQSRQIVVGRYAEDFAPVAFAHLLQSCKLGGDIAPVAAVAGEKAVAGTV